MTDYHHYYFYDQWEYDADDDSDDDDYGDCNDDIMFLLYFLAG